MLQPAAPKAPSALLGLVNLSGLSDDHMENQSLHTHRGGITAKGTRAYMSESILSFRPRRAASASPQGSDPTPFLFHAGFARLAAVCALAASANYLFWRISSSMNGGAIIFSVLVLLAEILGFVSSALFSFMTWDTDRKFHFATSLRRQVDVFVPTYNEDPDVIEATLIGCATISHHHTTYVLDDGHRPEIRALAQRFGCKYLSRAVNTDAKAGNLNAALAKTNGEFIVVLDADTVPQPDLLDETLGYFADPKVALVQLPQEFYNVDSVQHTERELHGEVWHEQQLFYRVIQPGKNRWNAAFWCGSPSVVRRSALLDIGGVATGTVTEDLHTTVRLHARDWKTVYHDQVLAFGIAPQTLHAFTLQRLRWAQGAMQLLRSRDNPFVVRGLSVAQRLNYFGSILTYFDPFQKLILLVTPAVVLVTGILPIRASAGGFLLHWGPAFCLAILANVALGRGYFHPIDADIFNFLKMFTFLRAWPALLVPHGLRFRVTPKRSAPGAAGRERWLVLPHLVVFELLGVALVIGVGNLLWHSFIHYQQPLTMVVVAFWALVNVSLILLALGKVLGRYYNRRSYRFALDLPAILTVDDVDRSVVVSDISPSGIGVLAGVPVQPGSPCRVRLPAGGERMALEGSTARCGVTADGRYMIGVEFRALADDERRRLTAFLFVTLPRLQSSRELRAAG
jgi:cellulose synthase (UDP-forming)